MMSRILKYRELLLVAIIVVLIAIVAYRAPGFAAPESLANIFNDTSILIILALGQMAVILTKSIDLSVAANLSFTGMAVAMMNAAYPGIPLPAPDRLRLGHRSGARRHQRLHGVEDRHPVHRGDARHAHDLSRHGLRALGRRLGQPDPDDAGLPQRAAHLRCSAFRCSAGRRFS